MKSGPAAKWPSDFPATPPPRHSATHQATSRLRRSGFTLLEMLITISLMALLAGGVVATIAGGFRVWRRAAVYGISEQASLVAFERLRRDLHNTAPFALLPFSGTYDEMTFAVVGHDPQVPDSPEELGRQGYYLDGLHDVLCRSFTPYRLAREVRLKDRCEVVLEHVQRLRFDYFGAESGKETTEPSWSRSWDAKVPPAAVTISVTVQDGTRPASAHSTVVFLPPVGRSDHHDAT